MSLLDVNIADQQFKRMDYHYDLISGNVHRVDYETGMADQWHHAYTYDADNRITEAFTTTTTPLMEPETGDIAAHNEPGMTPYWDKQVEYDYYAHGPLSRTELGQEKVQGLDYVYTIQGWMKGVNSNTLYSDRDPGLDGDIGSNNGLVARDAYSYSLHYFEGDYLAIDAAKNVVVDCFTAKYALNDAASLYNGNIAVMATTITNPNTRDVLPLRNIYGYDQLNRLKSAISSEAIDLVDNKWGTIAPIYNNQFEYDANGNILNQYRMNESAAVIDSLTYRYKLDANGKRLQNRLYHVRDQISSGTFGDDIDDMGTFDPDLADINVLNNYVYDAEGRLVKDRQERLDSILWRVDGKVLKIIRPDTSLRKNIIFDYDAMGHRIAKHVLSSTDELEHSTYYVLDAQGNVMSVYERKVDAMEESINFYQAEKHLYGSARLGVLHDSIELLGTVNDVYDMTITNHRIGHVNYELSNHLGNVLSTISDKPIPHDNSGTVDYWLADIRSSQDYSPFGVTLSGRNFTLTGAEKGRFGFNSMEGDSEAKGSGNSYTTQFRQYDSRLGRWLTLDPMMGQFSYQSPYCAYDNNPVFYSDPKGLAASGPIKGVFKKIANRISSGGKKMQTTVQEGGGNSDSDKIEGQELDEVVISIHRSLRDKSRGLLRKLGFDLSNDETELANENRDFIALVNAPLGASGNGHNAVLIGNDESGWIFISKEGRVDSDGNAVSGGKALPMRTGIFPTLQDFAEDPDFNEYKNAAVFEISQLQKSNVIAEMKYQASSKYSLISANCGHACIKAMETGGLKVSTTTLTVTPSIDGPPNVTIEQIGPSPVPNSQYLEMKRLNPTQLIVKRKI